MTVLPRIFLAFLLIITLIIIVGCSGWHLRGSQSQIESVNLNNAIFLTGENSSTYNATLKLLKSQGLLASNDNKYQLQLGKENFSSRTASLNADGLAAETELNLSIPYTISQKQDSGQRTTLVSTQAQLSRSYTTDNNDIGAKEKEESELRGDMSNAAARAIIRRLSLLANN